MLYIILLLLPFTKSQPNYNIFDDLYFNSVAEEKGSTSSPNIKLSSGNRQDTDKFPEDKFDHELASEFIKWAKSQPPVTPLSTYRPPVGMENITDNAFGAISKRCPPGCYLSRAGNCLPLYYNKEGQSKNKISCTVSRGGSNSFVLYPFRVMSIVLVVALVKIVNV